MHHPLWGDETDSLLATCAMWLVEILALYVVGYVLGRALT